jgi:type I restriction-modification system DNA methylase subunit
MSLFQNSVVTKQLQSQDKTKLVARWNAFKSHFHNPTIQDNIRSSKEEQYQGEFLIDLFVNVLGYTKNPTPHFTITTEYKNVKDSKKADGAILIKDKVKAVIELKGTNTTDLNKIEVQAFGYKNNQPDCVYVVTSNFEKLRFYIDNATEHIEFNLFNLTEKEFELLYLCLAYENIENDVPKKLKEQSLSKESAITKSLYNDYSQFKRELHQDLVKQNPDFDALELFKKSQKLLDRFLFLFFAEDRQLLPPNSVRLILNDWRDLQERDEDIRLYNRFKKYFEYLNTGFKGKRYDVFAYNGGLFKPDEVLDTILIDDELLFKHTFKLSEYDFASEVDVNILGHIFENSLNELDEIKAQLEGGIIDKSSSKRKKDGVFYTPKYITKYIVDNTIGKLCNDKKAEINIIEEDYFTDKKRNKITKQPLSEKLTAYRNWLLQITICDPACGSGAFLNQALDFLIQEHRYIDELQAKLFGDAFVLSDVEKSILENNLYGVDLNEESVEIAKLSLWLRTAQPNRKLNDLNNNIKCGNSLIDDVAIAGEKAFNWQTAFPKIFDKGGFDVIIGNPPYVQIQSMGTISNDLEKRKFETYEKTGDLYCLFYELGHIILKENGLLGFITSNKWMRANYGNSLRNYLIKKTQPIELLDLGSGIFESATVDSNILIFEKTLINNKPFIGLDISKQKYFVDFTIFESQKVEISPKINTVWSISSKNEQVLKNKFDTLGTPLKDWDIQINRGVLTGLTEAFIIDEDKKNELILKNIANKELLVPVLRGRDVNRYQIDYQNSYLINSHNGYKGVPKIDIENYIDIKTHLEQFEPQLSKRYDKGDTPFNLRNCAYLEAFLQPKIIWKEMSSETPFVIDKDCYFTNDTITFIIGEDLEYLLSLLNSKLCFYIYSKYYSGGGLGSTGIRFKKEFLLNLPLKQIVKENQKLFVEKADMMLTLNKELQGQSKKFQRNLQREFQLEALPKKLQDWYLLSYAEFIKELEKQKVKLSLSQKAEWEEYFTTEANKVKAIKTQIETTDKAIDAMVYELYGLSAAEIAIVESSN